MKNDFQYKDNILQSRNNFLLYANVRSELIYGEYNKEKLIDVSIIIPTYKRPILLKEAITTALTQHTNLKFEVIVMDNNNDSLFNEEIDNIIKNFNAPNLYLYRNLENIGMFGNWNRGVELAVAPWITILNDDDLLLPTYLSAFENILEQKDDADLIMLGFNVFKKNNYQAIKKIKSRDKIKQVSFKKLCIAYSRAGSLGIMYKKQIVMDIGGFNPNEYPSADAYFNIRYLALGNKGYEINSIHCLYRIAVNESQKPEVLAGFIIFDYKLRVQKAIEFFKYKTLVKIYAVLRVYSTIYSAEKLWKVRVPLTSLKSVANTRLASKRIVLFSARVISVFIKKILLIIDN